eukprot:gene4357-5087_t
MIEVLATYNNHICTKLGTHYSLWGGTILLLGTERHEKYIKPSDSAEILGCFSMTEIGHGSNVRSLETTATYDHSTQEFVVNSPTPSSHKFWIGGAGMHAHFTTVFARLIVGGKDHGVHAFVVPLRNTSNNQVMPNITIKDCGPKFGLNGIDNGHIRFNNVRIPRVNLLNKYSDVDENGVYKSQFATPVKNFAATMAPFVAGRASSGGSKTCLTVAIRYAHKRKQFGPGVNELPLITIPSQQRRLIVPVARMVTLDLYCQMLGDQLQSKKTNNSLHALCSGIKAIYSWFGIDTMQQCREACGGQGYRSENRIAEFRADFDINATYEGDNTVLLQQVAKYVLGLEPEDVVPVCIEGNAKEQLYNLNTVLLLFKTRYLIKAKEAKDIVMAGGSDMYAAFNASIPWSIKAAHAFMEYSILHNAIVKLHYANVQPLAHLVVLQTLDKIEQDLGWFVINNLITKEVATNIPYLIADLCSQLAPHSLAMVEAFDVPSK